MKSKSEKRKLKINFILPFKSLNGGVKVVLEYANRLTILGHSVTVTYPLFPYYFGEKRINIKDRWWQIRGFASNFIRGNKINWFDFKGNLKRVPWITDLFLDDSDIIVATAWITAYSVVRLSKQKGRKFYFIQGYEIWKGQIERVNNSYRLPLRKIVVASWLKKLIKEKFSDSDVDVITNGINLNEFYNDNKEFNCVPRILLLYHRLELKGISDALQAIDFVRKKHPDFKLVMFSTYHTNNRPKDVEFHFKPTGAKLRHLYCTSDIFIFPSRFEGFGLTPMEAMACKCAVVASNVGGIPDYAIPGKTALVFEPKDIQTMAEHIIYLMENPRELKRISFAGHEHIKNFTWEKAAKKMDDIFQKALDQTV